MLFNLLPPCPEAHCQIPTHLLLFILSHPQLILEVKPLKALPPKHEGQHNGLTSDPRFPTILSSMSQSRSFHYTLLNVKGICSLAASGKAMPETPCGAYTHSKAPGGAIRPCLPHPRGVVLLPPPLSPYP
jgi:hypothetical protein